MRILGIDYGDSRTGIAISDPLEITAQGLFNIDSKRGQRYVVEEVKKIVEEYDVEILVVGYPLNLNGTVGPRAEKTLEFIKELEQEITNVSIIKLDERLSTVAANKIMIETNTKRSKKRGKVDIIAAAYILQGYLDSRK